MPIMATAAFESFQYALVYRIQLTVYVESESSGPYPQVPM